VIDWLQATENIAAVAKGMRLSWEEVAGIRSRAVARGMKRRGRATLPASVGVDETSMTRGHEYITVVNALSEARVLDVIDERKEESLNSFWSQYSTEELARVERVAMDMWLPYIASTRKHLTIADEKIVFDKFHIMKHLGDAVDLVRQAENRQLQAVGDERLAKTRYWWLTHPERLEGEARARIDALRGGSLKTARAFRYEEHASKLWGYIRRGMAERPWRQWFHGPHPTSPMPCPSRSTHTFSESRNALVAFAAAPASARPSSFTSVASTSIPCFRTQSTRKPEAPVNNST
jgi:transposase